MALQEIYQRITSKGWALYEATPESPLEVFARHGSSTELTPGKSYIVCPAVQEPKNTEHIRKGFLHMKKFGKYPLIHHQGSAIAIAYFKAGIKEFTIHSVRTETLSIDDFCAALENLSTFEPQN